MAIDGSGTFDGLSKLAANANNAFLVTGPPGLYDFLNDIVGTGATTSVQNHLGDLFNMGTMADHYKKVVDLYKGLGEDISKEWAKMDQAAYNFGKQIGLSTGAVETLRNQILDLSVITEEGVEGLTAKLNMSVEELIQLHGKYSTAVERSVQLTNEQIKALGSMSRVVGDEIAVKLTASLDNFGLSATDAGEMLTDMYNKSVKQGISLEKYAKNVADHLGFAQKYTFKNGVDGLTAMAEKASKLKVDMDMVASLADKLSNISGAVTTSASLQVLGGPFAQFADPMGLLHDSLNDMEGLQDRLTNLTNSLGRFNRQTGEIEIATFDKMRLKEAASAMGVDYGKLIDQATTAARRNEVEYQMKGLVNIPDEYKELLMNTATFENGSAGVKGADGEFKRLSELTSEDLQKLADINKSEAENIADIAGMLRGFLDVREGEEKQKGTEAAKKYEEESANVKGIYKTLGGAKNALDTLVKIEIASKWVTPLYQQYLPNLMSKRNSLIGAVMAGTAVSGFFAHGGLIKTHSDGGYISDGIPGKEMILNSAQHGEFVMNAQSTQMFLPMLMMMNRNPMGMMGMMRGGMPYGGMMSTFGGGVAPGVQQSMGYGFFGDRYYNKIMSDLQSSAAQMKVNVTQQSLHLNRMGEYYDNAILTEQFNNRTYGDGKTIGPMEREYNQLVAERNYTLRKSNQLNNTALQERYARIKMAKFNKGMAIAGNAMTGVMGGVMAGMGTWGQYQADGTAIMDRGKALGGSIGAGVGGAVATGLLSCIPIIGPILGPTLGPMLGGAIGKGIGEWFGTDSEKSKNKQRAASSAALAGTDGAVLFSGLEGDYSVKELKAIQEAVSDGEFKSEDVSPELLEKIQTNGNELLLNNDYRKKSTTKIEVATHNEGGPTHANDDREYLINGSSTDSAQRGEFIVKRGPAQKARGLLWSINRGEVNDSNISSLLPLGPVVKVLESAVESIKSIPQNIKMEPLNINISGTIQLDCGQGNTMDIGKELMQNPTFVNKLTDLITRQININDNAGSFDKRGFIQRYLGV